MEERTYQEESRSAEARGAKSPYQGAEEESYLGEVEMKAKSSGFLSSLLGAGCECDGYSIYVVGHSLGGAIATLLGLRLYGQYPNLHVYAYGPLPCVDSVIAEACSEFVTSIIHDNEFSARLSVGSILRLRAAAIMALSEDSKTDTAFIFRLACRFLYISKWQRGIEVKDPSELHSPPTTVEDQNYEVHKDTSSDGDIDDDSFENPFHNEAANVNAVDNPVSQFLETVPGSENGSAGDPPEMFLPGLVIHLVPEQRNDNVPLWKSWRFQERAQHYNAYIANREDFKDIVVSPNMFLDHLPWKCRDAMQKILKAENDEGLHNEVQIV
ncbi:uncharacterized protein LOC131183002 [Hevea brasiliensis]|uniref:uncharacterized protein LOC131183002 n=1 Tax=Hevea brasiliensis TaxID=3981 RepID=UPI0025DEFEE9|nr:uncharacterized protein LOC131183002 [Hevea brasiliensis]